MLEIIKTIIPKLAQDAVLTVEDNLTGENGRVKKAAAIKFVIEHLPVNSTLKELIGYIFAIFIDYAIEIAVAFMNKYREEKSTEVL